jgi:hypothetical protein
MRITFQGGDFKDLFGQNQSQPDDRQEQPDSGSGKRQKQSGKDHSAKRKPAASPVKRTLVSLLVTLIFGAVYFYLEIPALNPKAPAFWLFLVLMLVVYMVVTLIQNGARKGDGVGEVIEQTKRCCKIPAVLLGVIAAIVVIGSLMSCVLFRADAYSKLLTIIPGDFAEEVTEVSWDQIPMLDKDSANTLANRKLGELSDLVSQFEVDEESAQINYQEAPVRVTYLNYGDIIKWWKNRSSGIPAYMITDMRTQEVTVVRLEEGIHYSPSEYFNHYIDRYLRLRYPTAIFGDVNFEIDEEGTPYWVASVEDRTIGLFGGTDVIGAVLVNAVTGECEYYSIGDVPSWTDRVYSADLLVTQYDYYGQYHNGFLNSIFGQTDCTVTTEGYNYIAMDDDVWLYTGITSVGGDESNVGFILVNQRTKEAGYYSCAGANEYSGMDSAEGAVQQYSYEATFPLLLNISGEPTYFMALKDASQLVKMYAMVNVQQYQVVAIGATVEACLSNYQSLLVENKLVEQVTEPVKETETVQGTIEEIRSAVMDGDTVYFIRLEGSDIYYTISASTEPLAVILNVGDRVSITCESQTDSQLVSAQAIEQK